MATCTDTLARASEARSKQGTHELEISFGGELDLHKHFQNCTKNPGHLNFIPIDSLHMHHLPDVFRTRKTFAWIKYMAEQTVKLSVRYVSSHRQPPLPLSDYAGQDILTVGSGFMSDICLVEGKHEMPCPFDNCSEQPEQHQVYGYIIITTAAHVVFDDDEAKNTTVEFFYDNPNDRSNVRTARGVKVGAVSVEGDFCEMLCVTHDRLILDLIGNTHIRKKERNLFDVMLLRIKVRVNYCAFQDTIYAPVLFPQCRKKDDIACPLEDCPYLSDSHNVYGYIFITIDVHVMFDYEKVKSATIELFYTFPEDSRNIRTARAEVVNAVSVNEDLCELQCVTHDKHLFDILAEMHDSQIGNLFRDEEMINYDLLRMFPCIEHVRVREGYLMSPVQVLSVDISLHNVSDCAELLVLLLTYDIDTIINNMSTKCSIKNMFSVEQEVNAGRMDINDLLQLNTSLVRKKGISIDDFNCLLKYQDLVLQLKTLLMAVPINVDSLNKFLTGSEVKKTESEVKETGNNIIVTQIYDNMLNVICMKSGYIESLFDESLQNLNIEDRDNEDSTSHDKLVVNISHPHGQSKQISFGTLADCSTGDRSYKPLYTVPTCPGCSGAPVWMMPATDQIDEIYGVPHGGCHDTQLNHGCSWPIYTPNTITHSTFFTRLKSK